MPDRLAEGLIVPTGPWERVWPEVGTVPFLIRGKCRPAWGSEAADSPGLG